MPKVAKKAMPFFVWFKRQKSNAFFMAQHKKTKKIR